MVILATDENIAAFEQKFIQALKDIRSAARMHEAENGYRLTLVAEYTFVLTSSIHPTDGKQSNISDSVPDEHSTSTPTKRQRGKISTVKDRT